MSLIKPHILAVGLLAALLGGCDQLGIETPDKVAARQEADGKAVGGACRHAGLALQDCYDDNRKASKAAIYAGWRDMDSYMRENNIAEVKPAEEVAEPEQPAESTKTATKDSAKAVDKESTKATASKHSSSPDEAVDDAGGHAATAGKVRTKTS